MLHLFVYLAQSHAFRLWKLHMSSLQLSDDDGTGALLGYDCLNSPDYMPNIK